MQPALSKNRNSVDFRQRMALFNTLTSMYGYEIFAYTQYRHIATYLPNLVRFRRCLGVEKCRVIRYWGVIHDPSSHGNGPISRFLGMLHTQQPQRMTPTMVGLTTPYTNVQDLSASTAPSGLPQFLSDATHEVLVHAGNTRAPWNYTGIMLLWKLKIKH